MLLAALLIATQVTAPGPSGRQASQTPPGRAAASTLPYRAPAGDPFTPETVVSVPAGPRVARLATPGSPVVAIRLSVGFEEAPAEAGIGNLLQSLATERARTRGNPLGVQVEGARTPWGIAYTVVGARADFDFLASLIQEVAGEPVVSEESLERLRRSLQDDLLRDQETPSARAFAELRAKAMPGTPPLEGTVATLQGVSRLTVRDFWRRTHRPSAMNVVVAGDIPEGLLYTAFDELGAPRGTVPRPTGPVATTTAPKTQTFRHWYGEAFAIAGPLEPHAAVLAQLVADQFRTLDDSFEADVQLWESDGGSVLAVVAAAYPPAAARMRTRVSGLLPAIRQNATGARVQEAAARAREDMHERARTPAGLVDVVGSLVDATGEPAAARRLFDAMGRVTLESTRTFLGQLVVPTPLRADVRP